jgi:hypothetical protein
MKAAALPFLIAAAACASARRGDGLPHIERITPDTVTLADGTVSEIIVHGSGFAGGNPGRNTIRVGDLTITSVPASDDGHEIRVVLPTRAPAQGDVAPLPIDAGRYPLTVATTRGTSNAVILRIGR